MIPVHGTVNLSYGPASSTVDRAWFPFTESSISVRGMVDFSYDTTANLMRKMASYLSGFIQQMVNIRLQAVPVNLRGIIFVAFYSNPIGDYLCAYCTYARLRHHVFWPDLFKACIRLIKCYQNVPCQIIQREQ